MAKINELTAELPAAFRQIVPTYAPAVWRIAQDQGMDNLKALYEKLSGKSAPSILDTLHSSMSAEELEAEKALLTPMMEQMAQDSYDARQVGRQIMEAIGKAAISVALAALTF
ncbi:MAG: hypothetical protein Q8P46_12585 [Hyphomicrobiales bacterium]|nr:hypothetical protein [Hyphomicrobiales bacterium]